jgi:NAD(P)-dependent dehydrogenase (short-subunit alcohol dehydrogenase family)
MLDAFDQDFRDCYQINVIGTINATAAFIPLLRKGSIKKVIALTSGMGDLDFTNELDMDMAVPYSISKAGLNMVMAKFSASYKEEGILFVSISPGAVDSEDDGRGTNDAVQDVRGDLTQSLYPVRPWHRFGTFCTMKLSVPE